MKKYFYRLLTKYLSIYIRPENTVIEINPKNEYLGQFLKSSTFKKVFVQPLPGQVEKEDNSLTADYIVLNGNLHYERDIQSFMERIHLMSESYSRILICYYSALWRPLINLATSLRIRTETPEYNWFSPSDLKNFTILSGFEIVNEGQRIIFPVYLPIISNFLNRWIAPLPVFRWFTMVNIAVLRPLHKSQFSDIPSVSIIVPARNEQGNIREIVKKLPKMGVNDELIFVEGNSTDDTWREIQAVQQKYEGQVDIKIAKQDGKGKGDAVRKGFDIASKEILMILDADMTVSPEELTKFYKAIRNNTGEFINGSRLVYPMEQEAMRFFNLMGNKFFAIAFSYVLNQPLKDTLCGTKVISRSNYQNISKNRSYFGNFDPFGDFDLLFGASRIGLKIIEIPITYKARTYGSTNIDRWRHGFILLKMLLFAARKIKFI
ncbi:glycosyltransferase family 2 protein [Rhodocytophaga rosea]|uniref:Glycosyltransferase family 2 protein n=1 Tax=Rhodocytophaga rosea TaxID=2704465 RepID=A0A6C0GR39_9BACT|nr:glycosyltransferase family 2 protein [Rhodocytophaga rosea]QHT70555.1 glycosyltransferase family 2 protein [Rhodocytophaga rosea]